MGGSWWAGADPLGEPHPHHAITGMTVGRSTGVHAANIGTRIAGPGHELYTAPSSRSTHPAQRQLMLPLPALIFCTCYADSPVVWESRYRRWINAIKRSSLTWWQILIVDDGSPCVPDWPDATFVDEGAPIPPDAELVVYRFKQRLGRSGIRNYPGWYRSFCFAGRYARAAGIEKVIHLESDAFLISSRIQEAFDSFREGWATVYVERYSMPESAIQVIAGSAIETLSAFCQVPYEARLDLTIENEIPFTDVFKEFRGGRYGETLDYIPSDAEWAVQVFPPMRDVDAYYWWLKDAINLPTNLPRSQTVIESYALAPDDSGKIAHAGVDYRDFLKFIDEQLRPSTYLEIGTHRGESVSAVSCDILCIDPQFMMDQSLVGRRSKAFFFQTTSDEFFHAHDPRHFLGDLDLGFLDGLHYFESLLRDFINFEKNSSSGSLALMHDCLPLNHRMAERVFQVGTEDEPPDYRDFWTGDVWRILPILREYRPDLEIVLLDCPPTGLVLIAKLNDRSIDLVYSYNAIVEKYSALTLERYSLPELWGTFPMLSSRKILADPTIFRERYQFRR